MKWPQTWTSKDSGVSMLWPCLCEVDSRVCLCTDLSRVPHNIQEVWGTNALISPPASQDSDTTVSDSSIWGHVFADAHCFKIERLQQSQRARNSMILSKFGYQDYFLPLDWLYAHSSVQSPCLGQVAVLIEPFQGAHCFACVVHTVTHTWKTLAEASLHCSRNMGCENNLKIMSAPNENGFAKFVEVQGKFYGKALCRPGNLPCGTVKFCSLLKPNCPFSLGPVPVLIPVLRVTLGPLPTSLCANSFLRSLIWTLNSTK